MSISFPAPESKYILHKRALERHVFRQARPCSCLTSLAIHCNINLRHYLSRVSTRNSRATIRFHVTANTVAIVKAARNIRRVRFDVRGRGGGIKIVDNETILNCLLQQNRTYFPNCLESVQMECIHKTMKPGVAIRRAGCGKTTYELGRLPLTSCHGTLVSNSLESSIRL